VEFAIRPQPRLRIGWRELWAHRELFYFFAWRDIKVRYKQTAVGALWAIFQPLMTMVVFTLFFNKVAGIKSGNLPYAVFSYTGLLFWNFFSTALTNASNSLVSNQAVITKIYFPRLVMPLAATIVSLVDVFAGLMLYYRIVPGVVGVLLFVPVLVASFVAASGIGMFLAAVNVKYRDVRYALPFFIQTLLFLTPVIYPVSLLPAKFQWFLYLNPMTGAISTVRSGLLHDGSIHWGLVGISLATTLLLFVVGLVYFRSQERKFADLI